VPFTRAMRRRGYKPGAKVITFETRPVEAAVAKVLKLSVASPVYFVRRLRFINKKPVMLESLIMPVRRFPHLERHNLAKRSIYEIMESEYGVRKARQSLEPTVATAYEAGLLDIAVGAPLMLERRLGFDEHGQPVEYGRDLYRGDRFRFTTEIAPLEL
jgi:GntR family transcriptional regulator, N-acetylglucosamine utilization regulator